MSETTGIGWTDSTWTPIQAIRKDTGKRGCACVKVSPGCKNCYSETLQLRNLPKHGTGLEFTVLNMEKVDIVVNEEILLQPLKWRKPRMIFVCSQTDLFGEFVTDEQIDRVFAVMALCPQHTFQVLTKRAERLPKWLAKPNGFSYTWREGYIQNAAYQIKPEAHFALKAWPLPNVWLGISAENQEWADKRIPFLLQTPAAKRFVSFEPLLGQITADFSGISWAIIGGESGHGARQMRVEWIEDLMEQCKATATACFVKQLGAYPIWAGAKCAPIEPAHGKCDNPLEWPESLRVQEFPSPAAPDAGGAR